MQKVSRRRPTDTPTDIPHVRGNCGVLLKSLKGKGSVARLSTRDNISDAVLKAKGQAGRTSRVSAIYVLNMRGQALMSSSPRKARILLRENRAVVATRTPFTLRLTVPTGKSVQPFTLGVNSGFTAPREVFGSKQWDRVKWNAVECFIFGRCSTGYFSLRTWNGSKVSRIGQLQEPRPSDKGGDTTYRKEAGFPPSP